MLATEPSNFVRCELLADLEHRSIQLQEQEKQNIRAWVASQRAVVLGSLQPIRNEDSKCLINVALATGGAMAFTELYVHRKNMLTSFLTLDSFSVLPKVKQTGRQSVMMSFVSALYSQYPGSWPHPNFVPELITDLLSAAISKTDYFYRVKSTSKSKPTPPPLKLSPSIAIEHIEMCLTTENEDLIRTIIEKLVHTKDLPLQEVYTRAIDVLLPLVTLFAPYLTTRRQGSPKVHGMTKLCRAAVSNSLALLGKQKMTNEDMNAILNAISHVPGGASLISEV